MDSSRGGLLRAAGYVPGSRATNSAALAFLEAEAALLSSARRACCCTHSSLVVCARGAEGWHEGSLTPAVPGAAVLQGEEVCGPMGTCPMWPALEGSCLGKGCSPAVSASEGEAPRGRRQDLGAGEPGGMGCGHSPHKASSQGWAHVGWGRGSGQGWTLSQVHLKKYFLGGVWVAQLV